MRLRFGALERITRKNEPRATAGQRLVQSLTNLSHPESPSLHVKIISLIFNPSHINMTCKLKIQNLNGKEPVTKRLRYIYIYVFPKFGFKQPEISGIFRDCQMDTGSNQGPTSNVCCFCGNTMPQPRGSMGPTGMFYQHVPCKIN